ncbi:hypothetical protein N9Y92_01095 [Chlamydiales bacterium]|nr:hypothetical protein [Chlamydiales bacterium]
MENAVKTRICWSCEGGLSPDESHCPYCGADQEILAKTNEDRGSSYTLVNPESTVSPIPIPIYKPQVAEPSISPEDLLKAQVEAVTRKKEEKAPKIEEKVEEIEEEDVLPEEGIRSFVLSLILMIGGSTFLLFGLVLFLFSNEGFLTIHWNSAYWPYYLILSLPCLFFGWLQADKSS